MKNLIKWLASRVSVDTYQRLLAYSILEGAFRQVSAVPVFARREDLWDDCIENQVGRNAKLTYVEFGVCAGYSIKYFAQNNLHESSVFIGLDSFEGLPEQWGSMAKGTFDQKGRIPKIDDRRISFIKGWFQATWQALLPRLSNIDTLVVHYDADLYSSTLFALSQMDCLKKSYIAIFDEFAGHESRALYNYAQAYNASVTFIGKTVWNKGYPLQVMCRITPHAGHSI